MANEIRVQSVLQVRKINTLNGQVLLEYASRPHGYLADMTGVKGPTPGAIEVAISGTSVDLSQLTTPGFCRITHLGLASDGSTDSAYYLSVGIWDPETARFYPMHELLPGEFYVARLARDLEEEYGTGTGTLGGNTNRLRLVARGGYAIKASVEAFEK